MSKEHSKKHKSTPKSQATEATEESSNPANPECTDEPIERGAQMSISRSSYKRQLKALQVELVKLQRHFIGCGDRIVVLLEGRDAAGKDGSIKRIVKYLSPRESRVVALSKPSDRDRTGWYFQRYVHHLPLAEEFVLFNRSWYNRAGVERVMGFCTEAEYEEFMLSVPQFEEMLVNSGIKLLKYYLDISKDEQASRLADRERNPLKQWKVSPIDSVALEHWADYSDARDKMLLRTNSAVAPWNIVRTDNKRLARLNLIRHILSELHYPDKDLAIVAPDYAIAFRLSQSCINAARLAS